jgi:hypothetical protein
LEEVMDKEKLREQIEQIATCYFSEENCIHDNEPEKKNQTYCDNGLCDKCFVDAIIALLPQLQPILDKPDRSGHWWFWHKKLKYWILKDVDIDKFKYDTGNWQYIPEPEERK